MQWLDAFSGAPCFTWAWERQCMNTNRIIRSFIMILINGVGSHVMCWVSLLSWRLENPTEWLRQRPAAQRKILVKTRVGIHTPANTGTDARKRWKMMAKMRASEMWLVSSDPMPRNVGVGLALFNRFWLFLGVSWVARPCSCGVEEWSGWRLLYCKSTCGD